MFMPVMFTVMFLWAPSGLVIYWFASNLWAIGQQYFTNWLIGPAQGPTGGSGRQAMNTAPIVEFVQQRGRCDGPGPRRRRRKRKPTASDQPRRRRRRVFTRRQGETLQALQQIVGSAFRGDRNEERRLVVDCNGYRRDKDTELHQMATFLAEKAKSTGLAQEIGPLNPYQRRIVHMAVTEVDSVTSESIGDAFEKTVIISVK